MQEGNEEQIEWNKWEETTKSKAAPWEAQSRRRTPGKRCEELLLHLEVQANLQKEERKAHSKDGLIFRANREKVC